MKCRLKQQADVPNPLYDLKIHRAAVRNGRTYPHRPTMTVDAGYVLSGANVWIHCCPGLYNAEPIAVPVDDECRTAVIEFMLKTRPARLLELAQVYENRHLISDREIREDIERQAVSVGLIGNNGDPNADLLERLGLATPAAENGDGETDGEAAGETTIELEAF